MGATVTETRFTFKPRYKAYAVKRIVDGSINQRTDDLWSNYPSITYLAALQRTTSFRSGQRAQSTLDPDTTFKVEDALDGKVTGSDEDEDPYLALKRFRSSTPQSLVSSFDTGHPFFTEKMTHTLGEDITLSSPSADWYYRGPILNGRGIFGKSGGRSLWQYPLDTDLNLTDLNLAGKKAISKTIPTLPVAGFSQFLGEAHEGLPRMLGHASLFERQGRAFNSLGSEYLNIQFGWLPFISDVKKFLKAFKNAGKILDQYRKDSGHIVRRKWSFPSTYTTLVQAQEQEDLSAAMAGTLSPMCWVDKFDFTLPGQRSSVKAGVVGKFNYNSVQKERVWFSGAYSYLLAEDDSFFGRMERYSQLADKLLGTRITPATLWELAPWSWLLDWEANIGVNITNATALGQDNLVLRWGYVMRTIDVRSSFHCPNLSSYSGYQGRVFNSSHYVRKERIRGTPYGFGLNTSAFSDRQWAILGALGMTRAPKQLF